MRSAALLLATAVLFLTACGHSPSPRLHTLASIDESPPAAAAAPAFSIVITGCSVPDAVDRPQFMLAMPGNALRPVDGERWSEPLKRAIPRAVAQRLRASMPEVLVWSSPAAPTTADVRLTLEVTRWHSVPDAYADVEILWQLRLGGENTTGASRSRVEVARSTDGYGALAAAHRRALEVIADDIAAAARTLLRKTQHRSERNGTRATNVPGTFACPVWCAHEG